jgi:hypothetical protein
MKKTTVQLLKMIRVNDLYREKCPGKKGKAERDKQAAALLGRGLLRRAKDGTLKVTAAGERRIRRATLR